MSFLSNRITSVPPYLFSEINRKKQLLMEQGVDVIDLGIGSPDLPTPRFIVDRLIEELKNDANFKYSNYNGHIEFRQAVAYFYKENYNVDLDPESEVLALIGSKEGIAHVIPAVIDSGDYVITPDPGYPVYRMATHLAGGKYYNMTLHAERGYQPIFDDIPQDIRRKAKMMFLNYPGNPTAATVDVNFFDEAVQFAKENNILIAHDSAYNLITYGDYKAPSILEADGAKDVAIEFGSLSKSYNMMGWRIGFVVGNKEVIRGLSVVKSNTDTSQFTPIQLAAATALRSNAEIIKENSKIYEERMASVLEALQTLQIDATPSKGSIFIWAPVPDGYTSTSFCTKLLEEAGVIVTPGNAFGPSGEGYFRLSLSVPSQRLKEAVERIKKIKSL